LNKTNPQQPEAAGGFCIRLGEPGFFESHKTNANIGGSFLKLEKKTIDFKFRNKIITH